MTLHVIDQLASINLPTEGLRRSLRLDTRAFAGAVDAPQEGGVPRMRLLAGVRVAVLCAIAGAACGLGVWATSRLSGVTLFAVLGAVLAAAVGVVTFLLKPRVQLAEVKIFVPQFSEMMFLVDDRSRVMAWQLLAELSTRVSIQRLGRADGLPREALSSLHSIVLITRNTLKNHRPPLSPGDELSVESLALSMINLELRPFLNKWHPRLHRHEISSEGGQQRRWPEEDAFRNELSAVQENMLTYIHAFAKLVGVRNLDRLMAFPNDSSQFEPPSPRSQLT